MKLRNLFESNITPVVVYGGRFQPPHDGHRDVYKHACKQFGKSNVYIAMSNKTGPDSPGILKTRKKQWLKHGAPDSKIVLCKNPAFKPTEILNEFSGRPYIAVVGEKDRTRYEKSFEEYTPGMSLDSSKSYYYVVPMKQNGLSGTQVRKAMKENEPKV